MATPGIEPEQSGHIPDAITTNHLAGDESVDRIIFPDEKPECIELSEESGFEIRSSQLSANDT